MALNSRRAELPNVEGVSSAAKLLHLPRQIYIGCDEREVSVAPSRTRSLASAAEMAKLCSRAAQLSVRGSYRLAAG